jgi:endonuclease/exonuclease/phosphatase family metal-dependent hydrolase
MEPAARGEAIRIATFNIQVFGQSKLEKPEVMKVLAATIRRFDVVAIQEVRSTDQDVLPRFVAMINADGSQYDFVIGPRLGRTSSKEQYAFVFDTTRIAVDPQSIYTISDPQDLLHREPFVARFQALGPSPGEAFTFTLVNIHTDPDEAEQELDALDDVFRIVQNQGEDDVILLGDLNVDDRHFGELGVLPGIAWVISGQPTNTRRTKQYDNVVFDSRATIEYSGASGVFELQSEFALTLDQALEVSDHLPVWAEFSPYENQPGRALASQATGTPR